MVGLMSYHLELRCQNPKKKQATQHKSRWHCSTASSKPHPMKSDVVLDPFCGCATACVAAERLGRQWIGIDISPSAETITKLPTHRSKRKSKAGRGTGTLEENQLPLPC